ncbi:MAG: flavin reductase family protein [Pseudomonadota bacterium]
MFYRPGQDDHGLPHNPFKAMVSPRPIGWISTIDERGRPNLAPYSFFNAIADAPPLVMFSNTGTKDDQPYAKDTVANIRATGEFATNIVGLGMRDAMNASSGPLPAGENEFTAAGLEQAPCELIRPPRVAGAPGAFECKLWRIVDLPGDHNVMVIGEVVGVHIDDAMLTDGRFDVMKYQPLSRLGYRDYATVTEVFSLNRPGQS